MPDTTNAAATDRLNSSWSLAVASSRFDMAAEPSFFISIFDIQYSLSVIPEHGLRLY